MLQNILVKPLANVYSKSVLPLPKFCSACLCLWKHSEPSKKAFQCLASARIHMANASEITELFLLKAKHTSPPTPPSYVWSSQ